MMERALLDRRFFPAVACRPGKNEIWGPGVAFLARNAVAFGALIGSVKVDTANIEWA
jgi:hypothetical protein